MSKVSKDRRAILLKACYDALKKQHDAPAVISVFQDFTVHYDDADCDGYCLMEDIESELDLEPTS